MFRFGVNMVTPASRAEWKAKCRKAEDLVLNTAFYHPLCWHVMSRPRTSSPTPGTSPSLPRSPGRRC